MDSWVPITSGLSPVFWEYHLESVPAFLFETSLSGREKIPSPRCNGQWSTLMLYKYGLKVRLYVLHLDIGQKKKGQGVWSVQWELLARKHFFVCGNGCWSYRWERKAKELELNLCTLWCSLDVQVRRVSSGHMKLSLREFLGVNTGNCVTNDLHFDVRQKGICIPQEDQVLAFKYSRWKCLEVGSAGRWGLLLSSRATKRLLYSTPPLLLILCIFHSSLELVLCFPDHFSLQQAYWSWGQHLSLVRSLAVSIFQSQWCPAKYPGLSGAVTHDYPQASAQDWLLESHGCQACSCIWSNRRPPGMSHMRVTEHPHRVTYIVSFSMNPFYGWIISIPKKWPLPLLSSQYSFFLFFF